MKGQAKIAQAISNRRRLYRVRGITTRQDGAMRNRWARWLLSVGELLDCVVGDLAKVLAGDVVRQSALASARGAIFKSVMTKS